MNADFTNVKPSFDARNQIDRICSFLQQTLREQQFSDVVIGLSGGVDSAVSCALAVRALGASHVFPILMPYGNLSSVALQDARMVIESLQIPTSQVTVFDIQKQVDSFSIPEKQTARKGNVMARVRMITLFDRASELHALVCGTENRTEHVLGYFTRYGDSGSDVEPIAHLWKTQVYLLATKLGLPEKILTKAPTANLWAGQSDEGEFGFSYTDCDRVLAALFDEKISEQELAPYLNLPQQTVEKILSRMRANAFKHIVPYIFSTINLQQ